MSMHSKLSIYFTSFWGRSWKLLELILNADNGVRLTAMELIGLVMDVASVSDVLNIWMSLICKMDGIIPGPMGIK